MRWNSLYFTWDMYLPTQTLDVLFGRPLMFFCLLTLHCNAPSCGSIMQKCRVGLSFWTQLNLTGSSWSLIVFIKLSVLNNIISHLLKLAIDRVWEWRNSGSDRLSDLKFKILRVSYKSEETIKIISNSEFISVLNTIISHLLKLAPDRVWEWRNSGSDRLSDLNYRN